MELKVPKIHRLKYIVNQIQIKQIKIQVRYINGEKKKDYTLN